MQIAQALEWAGLVHHETTHASSLSGGERQRVALARAWLRRPRVLLLDEPTANLDQAARKSTLELLSIFKPDGMAMLLASHDMSFFSGLINHHVHLADRCLIQLDNQSTMRADSTNVTPIHRGMA